MGFKNEELIKEKIVEAHKRGICNGEGDSITDSDGRPKAPPRKIGNVIFRKVYPKYIRSNYE